MSDVVKCRWPACEDDSDCMNGCKPAPSVEHTPTPWMTHRAGEMRPDDWMIMADMGKTPNGIQQVSTVARALSIRQTPETTAANAAFIVEAVNSYGSLKAENERLRNQVEGVPWSTDFSEAPTKPHDFFLLRPREPHPATGKPCIPSIVQRIDGEFYTPENELEPVYFGQNEADDHPLKTTLEWKPLPADWLAFSSTENARNEP